MIDWELRHQHVEHLLPRQPPVALGVHTKEPAVHILRQGRHTRNPVDVFAADGAAPVERGRLACPCEALGTKQLLRASRVQVVWASVALAAR
eukprot:scaffold13433_cov67-Phaeocystis_antarctica.AAC.2